LHPTRFSYKKFNEYDKLKFKNNLNIFFKLNSRYFYSIYIYILFEDPHPSKIDDSIYSQGIVKRSSLFIVFFSILTGRTISNFVPLMHYWRYWFLMLLLSGLLYWSNEYNISMKTSEKSQFYASESSNKLLPSFFFSNFIFNDLTIKGHSST
jgi:hypothetical protein